MDFVSQFSYVINLLKFAFRANPLLSLSIAVSLLSVGIELLAMTSLLPLFELVSGRATDQNGLIPKVLTTLGVLVNVSSLLWTFVGLFALRILTQLAGQSLSLYFGKRVMAQLCSQAFTQIVHHLSIREINQKSVGFYIGLAGDESFKGSTLVIALTQFVSTAVLAFLYFLAIAKASVPVAVFVISFLGAMALIFYRILKISHRLGGRQVEESRRTGSVFLDALNNIKAVRAYSAEGYVSGIHRNMMFGYTRTLFWVDEVALLTRLVPILLLLVVLGAWLALSPQTIEKTGIAFIVTMIVFLMRFFPIVGQAVNLLTKIASDAKSGKDVTAILGAPASSVSRTGKALGPIKRIELRNVSFSYSAGPENNVLRGIDLTFEAGKIYALVGKSGTGKTTLIDILLRFYRTTEGELFLNGHPVSEMSDSEVREKIILISQEAAIFDDTVFNNLCLGHKASRDAVIEACRIACIHDHIETMADGYETRLQYLGSNLSGGQRQRIGIARALLRSPDVLILDESTNALDKATQEKIVENIRRTFSDKIVVFITHDPDIVSKVDVAVNLEKLNAR